MKKTIILTAIIIFGAMMLCSCSNFFHKPDASPDPQAIDQEQQYVASAVNGDVDLDSLSLDELLALYDQFLKDDNDAANDGVEADLFYGDIEPKPGAADAEIGFEYSSGAQTAVYSDAPWEDKTVEALDITANMSPEDKAAYEAAMKELEDFDAQEFQNGMNEMIQGLEGFEDYDPEQQGGESGLLNEWPDNELTRQVPKPPFEDPMIVSGEDSITVMNTSSTLAEAKAYVEQLKGAGFTVEVYENTNEVAGYTIYTFNASNSKGYSVSLTFTSGTTTVNVIKG